MSILSKNFIFVDFPRLLLIFYNRKEPLPSEDSKGQTRSLVYQTRLKLKIFLVFVLLILIILLGCTAFVHLLDSVENIPTDGSHYEGNRDRPSHFTDAFEDPLCTDSDEVEGSQGNNWYKYVHQVFHDGVLDVVPVFLTHTNAPFGPVWFSLLKLYKE